MGRLNNIWKHPDRYKKIHKIYQNYRAKNDKVKKKNEVENVRITKPEFKGKTNKIEIAPTRCDKRNNRTSVQSLLTF